MKELSKIEKETHHNSLKSYVNIINECVIPCKIAKSGIQLVEVSYGVPIDNEYFYFDYPYSETVDKFNADLATDEYLTGVDIKIHDAFYALQDNGKTDPGYIYYEYSYIHKDECYHLYDIDFSLNLSGLTEEAKKFLPIMHCAITNEISYKQPVVRVKGKGQKILILSKRLEKGNHTIIDENTLICTFQIKSENFKIEKSFVAALYDEIVKLLESYFDSPVLLKLLSQHRRSEILPYQHTIGNLKLGLYIKRLKYSIDNDNLIVSKKRIKELTIRNNLLDVLHYSMFQLEYITSGRLDLNNAGSPFTNKTVTGMINYFISDLNIYEEEVKSDFKIKLGAENVDFIPKNDEKSTNAPDTLMFDIQLVLWNVWINACRFVATRCTRKVVWITAEAKNNHLLITLKNDGQMKSEYIEYINDRRKKYPKRNSDPNKPYKGLQIVRDICSSLDRNWAIRGEITKDNNGVEQTEISITF